jgi:hypothetical protein
VVLLQAHQLGAHRRGEADIWQGERLLHVQAGC